ncbi:YHS domain-containing (seleno)protein [Shimia abyssi]|uniref:YHS domain-containing protein n=1 Tax=Shimia abyssi TaxID=1662395 RepID=A0A2P8EYL2_9RHOB|nr:YHS domain-containing (seleno)protein [Shimia abyssi]PSL14540.1 YHS domain-containing protein [Shimia abyssi]
MLTRRTALGLLAAAPATLTFFPGTAIAQKPEVFQNPVAINAVDPIGYFEQSRPLAGSADHKVEWNGAEWNFSSERNASMFASDPETYAPVFGGYCAFAASRGYLAPTIPEAWTIYEGKLYLNASLRAQDLWRQDIPGNIAAGLKSWPGILG